MSVEQAKKDLLWKLTDSSTYDPWFCRTLAEKLLLLDGNMPTARVLRGFRSALEISDVFVQQNQFNMHWSNVSSVEKVLDGVISRNPFICWHPSTVVRIRDIVTKLVILSDDEDVGINLPLLHFIEQNEVPSDDTALYLHSLVMSIPVPEGFPLFEIRDAIVAIFESTLEYPSISGGMGEDGYRVEATQESFDEVGGLEVKFFSAIVDYFLRENVSVVACQKLIHPKLQQLCQIRGILCLPRLSIQFVRALAQHSGAVLLGGAPWPNQEVGFSSIRCSVGYLSRLCTRHIFDKTYVVAVGKEPDWSNERTFENICVRLSTNSTSRVDKDSARLFADGILKRRRSFHTVFITGATEAVTKSMQDTVQRCLRLIRTLFEKPLLLYGGGLWQYSLGTQLLERCRLRQKELFDLNSNDVRFKSAERCEVEVMRSFANALRSFAARSLFGDIDGEDMEKIDRILLERKKLCSVEWENEMKNEMCQSKGSSRSIRETSSTSSDSLNDSDSSDSCSGCICSTSNSQSDDKNDDHSDLSDALDSSGGQKQRWRQMLSEWERTSPFESAEVARWSLRVAVEAASCVLQVDGVVVAEAERVR